VVCDRRCPPKKMLAIQKKKKHHRRRRPAASSWRWSCAAALVAAASSSSGGVCFVAQGYVVPPTARAFVGGHRRSQTTLRSALSPNDPASAAAALEKAVQRKLREVEQLQRECGGSVRQV